MRRGRSLLILAGCVLLSGVTACSSRNGKPNGGSGDPTAAGDRVTLFFSTELKGQLEPCGCNSDPMGDIARTIALVEAARAAGGPVLFFDGGSSLYQHVTVPTDHQAQESLQAGAMTEMLEKHLSVAAAGLGPFDLAAPAARPARQAANLAAGGPVPVEAPKVIEAGKILVGVFGVVAPDAVAGAKLDAGDPVAAATAAVADLRGKGAQVVVAIAHMQKRDARELARKVNGIDFMLVGQNAPEPTKVSDTPDQVGQTWLIQPANRGQVISRVEIGVRGGGPFADAAGPARIPVLEKRLASVESELAGFEKDPDADKAFVAAKKKEAASVRAELDALRASPTRVPEKGSWFTLEQVRIKRQLACDAEAVAAKRELDRKVGEVNLEVARKKGPPPAPAKGAPGYVGVGECEMCHAEAVAFWRTTRHAGAWKTLTDVGKDRSYDCVSCHVTGWEQPGGATLAFNDATRDVQCEVCHGPGSLHVAANGKEKKSTLVRTPTEDVCLRCHNEDHSDTFDFEPYLRDVTGKGHGQARRAALGDGPTGHELRKAALDRAGRDIGAGCTK